MDKPSSDEQMTLDFKEGVERHIQAAIGVLEILGEDGFQKEAKNGGVPTLVASQKNLEARFPLKKQN
jgi:hypothetical protein